MNMNASTSILYTSYSRNISNILCHVIDSIHKRIKCILFLNLSSTCIVKIFTATEKSPTVFKIVFHVITIKFANKIITSWYLTLFKRNKDITEYVC